MVIGQLGFWFDGERVEVRCIAPGTVADIKVTYQEQLANNRGRQKRLRLKRNGAIALKA